MNGYEWNFNVFLIASNKSHTHIIKFINSCEFDDIIFDKIKNAMTPEIRVQKRCLFHKKELIERTWHPSRFINWCLDHEEQNEIVSLFSNKK